MKATYSGKEQDFQSETTYYDFTISSVTESYDDERVEFGDSFRVADCNGDLAILDCDGCPVSPELKSVLSSVLVVTPEMISE